jgi:hypothetical protein
MKSDYAKRVAMLAAVLPLAACVGVSPSPPPPALADIPLMCVKTNESAPAPEFVADVRHALEHYGTKSLVYGDAAPAECRFRLTYVTEYRLDQAPMLSAATMRIHDGPRLIGQVSFDYYDITRRLYERTNAEKANYLVSILYPPRGTPGARAAS